MRSQSWFPGLLLCLLSSSVYAADAQPTATKVADTDSKQKSEVTAAAQPPAAPRGNDQLILDSTLVTGNRELPKVMYIVPWKKAELSDLPGQPFNTLVDDTLAPIDREVFRREVDYYLVIADKDRAVPEVGRQATPATDKK